MEELVHILKSHAARYPEMEPTDAVKLIFQNEFGGGHMIRDEDSCMAYLRRECENTERNRDIPLWEEIGNGIVRVNLTALTEEVYPVEQLGRDFIRTAAAHKGEIPSFLEKLGVLRQLTEEGIFPFSPAQLEIYLTQYAKAGYPPVSHSQRYRDAYHPAYRVILKKYLL